MKKRNAEIVGAGFAGLTAACALAQRGWSVRVHERADRLRTTSAGIYIYENGLRVLEAVGAYDGAVQGAPFAHTREVRDGRDRLISVHRWTGSRVFSIVRQNVINALAAAATRAGVVIATNSTATGATAEGELLFADGSNVKADLIVGADGSNSQLRNSLGLLFETEISGRWLHPAATGQNRSRARTGRRRQDDRILVGHAAASVHAVQRDRHLYCAHHARRRCAREGSPGA